MLPARTVPAWAALKTLALSGTPFPTGVLQAVSKYSRSLCVSAADMAASEQAALTPATSNKAPPLWPRRPLPKDPVSEHKQLNQRLMASRTVPDLLRLVDVQGHRFNYVNASTALAAFVRLQLGSHTRSQPALSKLLDLVVSYHTSFTARERGDTLRSLALLDLHHSALLRSMTTAPSQWVDYHPRHIPSVLWALGRLSHSPPQPVLDILLGHMQAALPHFDCADLANCLWAFMRLKLPVSGPLQQGFLQQVHRQLPKARPPAFTSILYSLATLPLAPEPPQAKVALAYLDRHLASFEGPDLSVALWSLNSLAVRLDPELLDRCYRQALRHIGRYSPQQRSMMITALQLYGHAPSEPGKLFLQTSIAELRAALPRFKLKEICAIMQACAALRFDPGHQLCIAVVEHVCKRVTKEEAQAARLLLHSLASLSHPIPTELLQCLRDTVTSTINDFEVWELTTFTWALSVLRIMTPEVWKQIEAALLGRLQGPAAAKGMSMAELVSEMDPVNLMQLQQSWMAFECDSPGLTVQPHPALMYAANMAWKNTVKRTLISELHRRVSRALSSMGLQHECEVVTDDGLFSVDIMLRDERIIVEVDGPSHYTYNSQQRLGSAAMRTRLLEARGWQVVAVPFFEWNQACERDRQLDYLWSKLPPHLATRGGLWGSG